MSCHVDECACVCVCVCACSFVHACLLHKQRDGWYFLNALVGVVQREMTGLIVWTVEHRDACFNSLTDELIYSSNGWMDWAVGVKENRQVVQWVDGWINGWEGA